MPIYEYKCKKCRRTIEAWYPVTHIPDRVKCPCGKMAKKVLSRNGAIHTDGDVKWLASACKVMQRDGEKPIETRGEYERYLKENNYVCKG
jgi:putative FmdB family regulatory protein